MKDHKYKLATLVVSTGLLLGACGSGDETQTSEDQTDDTTVEQTEDTTTEEGTEGTEDSTTTEDDTGSSEESPDDSSDEQTAGDTEDSEGAVEGDSSDGTGGSDDGEADTTEEGSESTDSTGVAVLDQLGSTPEDAVSAAQENFDGELVELELDEDNSEWVYDVHLENDSEEYEVQLSAEDLSVMNEETETDDDNDTEDQFSYGDAIPHDEAVQTAVDEAGGDLEGWTLDRDDGQLEYDVELVNTDSGNDVDVTINAESGEVIETDD